MSDFQTYREVNKKVKVIYGKDTEEAKKKLDEFIKANERDIIGIKQGNETMYFVFYWEAHDEQVQMDIERGKRTHRRDEGSW